MKVPCTITTGADRCDFIFPHSNFSKEDQSLLKQRNETLGKRATKSLNYHAGHLYYFMKSELQIAYKNEAEKVMTRALAKYREHFGEEVVAVVLRYKDQDFQTIGNYPNS